MLRASGCLLRCYHGQLSVPSAPALFCSGFGSSGRSCSKASIAMPVRAQAEQASNAADEEMPSTAGRVVLTEERPERRETQGLRLQKVERLGQESWAGVAAVDRGGTSSSQWRSAAVLAAGDTVALLLFAAIGQASHSHSVDPASTLRVAAPFLLGWFAAARVTGAYSPVGGAKAAAWQASRCWAVGIPAGILLRSILKGHFPELGFAGVTMGFTFLTLVGWRAALGALTLPKGDEGSKITGRRRGDTQGNPLEFLQLLTSLVKRW